MEAFGELMDPDALKELRENIAKKVANKEEMTVPLHFLYWSDGREDKVPGPKSQMTQQDPAEYLEMLSKKYYYNVNLVFTSLPRNYTVWKQNPPRADLYLYGHPRGRFPSTDQFTYHVWSLLNNKVSECDCRLCEGNVRGQARARMRPKH
ncbi:unnamed protein product [Aureobasidium vineae]|uniref:Cryptic loci regulator 2 N-terminal domain-containing protein n=1 Tax=Aureobasidium vineae TaxID=2773715 RepID=A0A9N8JPM2_9PEZI|nr:unnamed protein product [Aureobasidium vineae]